jgi:acyl-CoA reductase-like NAD-dependent aldehyde dehydrogenase
MIKLYKFSPANAHSLDLGILPPMLQIIEPATEKLLLELPAASATDIGAAVRRAKSAFPAWKKVAPAERARLLFALAAKIEANIDWLARLESQNCGKPIGNARWEVSATAQVFRYYAGAVERHMGATIPVSGGVAMTFLEPMGVVGMITPWNFPLYIASWKLAPALAAGNCCVLKPAELTPLTAIELEKLALEAGLPEGVLNIVVGTGLEAGRALVEHPDVAKIGFTGSTTTGKDIAARAAQQIKRVTLELGGKSACIIMPDADIEAAAASIPSAVFENSGQDCCCRSRLLVHKNVLDKFMAALEPHVKNYRVGDPNGDVDMGPLISKAHLERVSKMVDGVKVAIQGSAPSGAGYWFAPLVLEPEYASHNVVQEEIFGPVTAVVPFGSEAEAVELANSTVYGLSGSIWTRDGAAALRMARGIESGVLSVNSNSSVRYTTPFGGMKQSGYGRELGARALEAYSEEKTVFIRTEA